VPESTTTERTAWLRWIWFAAVMLVLVGAAQMMAGFVAVVDESYFQQTGATPLFLGVDQQTWGVLQLVLGAATILTAGGLVVGNPVARVVATGIVLLGAVTNLLAVDAYPVWSGLLLAVDLCVVYALGVHGGELRR
jgi:hypothetical protein